MRNLLIGLVIVATSSMVLASDPGERIGPEDFVFFVDSLTAERVAGPVPVSECLETEPFDAFLCQNRYGEYGPFPAIQADAEGTLYTWAVITFGGASRNEISRRRRNGPVEVVATLPYVRGDVVGNLSEQAQIESMSIDQTNGAIYLIVRTVCYRHGVTSCERARELIRIRGLTPMIDVLKEQKQGHGRPD